MDDHGRFPKQQAPAINGGLPPIAISQVCVKRFGAVSTLGAKDVGGPMSIALPPFETEPLFSMRDRNKLCQTAIESL